MRRTGLVVAILTFTVLALWSAWNPGYYYLVRAAGFAILGGVSVWVLARRQRRFAPAAALSYLAVVCGVAALGDLIGAQQGRVESVAIFLIPVAAILAVAAGFVAVAPSSRPGRWKSRGGTGVVADPVIPEGPASGDADRRHDQED